MLKVLQCSGVPPDQCFWGLWIFQMIQITSTYNCTMQNRIRDRYSKAR